MKTHSKSFIQAFKSLKLSKHAEMLESPLFRDRFSVAPMMEYTDHYQRKFQRLLSRKTVLYTEMITGHALIHSPHPNKLLLADFVDEEPIVLQLGGSDPAILQKAATIAVNYGYKEINLNVGCPSEKVAGNGCFGAALMLQPQLVANICTKISEVTPLLPTVKCRIGVDNQDSYEELKQFITIISQQSPVQHFIIHARKAILTGKLTPDQNRKIPPLKYEFVYQLVQDFPHLKFSINGGIQTIEEAISHLVENKVHGVMVGRAIVNQPYQWRLVDSLLYNTPDPGNNNNNNTNLTVSYY
jgi:tRNA-dihydrouridine synthase A